MERFWSKVKKAGPDDCWEWQASFGSVGYGQFYFDGKPRGAHRVAYLLEIGEIPEGMQILHSCDNRACCNPAHLHVGTDSQNKQERAQRRNTEKLTIAEVHQIRELLQENELSQSQIGKRFGVSQAVVSAICCKKIWGHV